MLFRENGLQSRTGSYRAAGSPSLLIAQGHHGIDSGGAAGGNVTGKKSSRKERHCRQECQKRIATPGGLLSTQDFYQSSEKCNPLMAKHNGMTLSVPSGHVMSEADIRCPEADTQSLAAQGLVPRCRARARNLSQSNLRPQAEPARSCTVHSVCSTGFRGAKPSRVCRLEMPVRVCQHNSGASVGRTRVQKRGGAS
jgi:hypothetical protein